jgi:hypothetical protein
MNYDTVLPDRILRRYRRRRSQWIKRSLAIGAFTLGGLALLCGLALIMPRSKSDPRYREIIHRAINGANPTPTPVPRATLVKLPDDNWNNVCTP